MEKQNGLPGLSIKAWGVFGLLAVAAGAMVICALVLLAYGIDIGVGVN